MFVVIFVFKLILFIRSKFLVFLLGDFFLIWILLRNELFFGKFCFFVIKCVFLINLLGCIFLLVILIWINVGGSYISYDKWDFIFEKEIYWCNGLVCGKVCIEKIC